MTAGRPVIALLGAGDLPTAYSLINRQWWRGLTAAGYRVCQSLPAPAARGLGEPPECVIHHDWQQKFSELEAVGAPLAAVRPWDFGPYPRSWVATANRVCDQLWVHSRWVERQALDSGVEASRLRRVPLGFDPDLYRPDGEVYPLATGKRFHFLFTGATIQRKGIDVLIKAYSAEFSAQDDVCLVIKDHSGNVFYREISYREEIAGVAARRGAPAIFYLDDFLTEAQLAALYRACDAGVFPYRAEGFCLPILELVGSGRPVIVPDFGACLDYCRPDHAFLVPAKRICLPIQRRFAVNTLGFDEAVDGVDFCEVAADDLAARMRAVYETSSAELRARGARGRELAVRNFSWQVSVARVRDCVEELLGRAPGRSPAGDRR